MLIRFTVQNCLSFKEKTEFTMAAGKQSRHPNHLATIHEDRILKGTCIFGPNASGKSNFVKAMALGRDLVLSGMLRHPLMHTHFRLDDACRDQPTLFQYDFYFNDRIYSYSFSVIFSRNLITEEWLADNTSSKPHIIFMRVWDEESRCYAIKASTKITDDTARFKIYTDDFSLEEYCNRLFLTGILKRLSKKGQYPVFSDVYNWFGHLIIILPTTIFGNYGDYIANTEGKKSLKHNLAYFDTGINDIEKHSISYDEIFNSAKLAPETKELIQKQLNDALTNPDRSMTLMTDDSQYHFHAEDGKLNIDEILYRHADKDDSAELFRYGDEADGTKRLINLLPILSLVKEDLIFVIDELDRSLHTKVTQEFLHLFYKLNQEHHSQLIFTSHDLYLMDLNLLRQDEIWYMERNYDHSSSLFSLNKYSVRFDKKLDRDYLAGRFGAVPQFDPGA